MAKSLYEVKMDERKKSKPNLITDADYFLRDKEKEKTKIERKKERKKKKRRKVVCKRQCTLNLIALQSATNSSNSQHNTQ